MTTKKPQRLKAAAFDKFRPPFMGGVSSLKRMLHGMFGDDVNVNLHSPSKMDSRFRRNDGFVMRGQKAFPGAIKIAETKKALAFCKAGAFS